MAAMMATSSLPAQAENMTSADKATLTQFCEKHNVPFLTQDGKAPGKVWMQVKVYLHMAGLPTGDPETNNWLAARFGAKNDDIKTELYRLLPQAQHGQIANMKKHDLFLALCHSAHSRSIPQPADNEDVIMRDAPSGVASRASSLSKGKGRATQSMHGDSDGGEGSQGWRSPQSLRSQQSQPSQSSQQGQQGKRVKAWLNTLQPGDTKMMNEFVEVLLNTRLMQRFVKMQNTVEVQNTSSSVPNSELVRQRDEALERLAEMEARYSQSQAHVLDLSEENDRLTTDLNDMRDRINHGDRDLAEAAHLLAGLRNEQQAEEARLKSRWEAISRFLSRNESKLVY